MNRHSSSVYGFLVSLGAPPADAEDALQDCFVSAWTGAATFRGDGTVRGWLFSIARNALRRQHRRRVGEPDSLESLDELGERAGWGSPADFRARFEARETLAWAMRQIPDEERQVIALRDLNGLPGAETAEALGLSVPAMKSRLHRGRLRLLAALRTLEDDDA